MPPSNAIMTAKNRKKLFEFVIILGLIYTAMFIYNMVTPERTEWITDDWKISSKADRLLFPLFPIVMIVLILGGVSVGLWLAYRMLLSDHRRIWFGGFFILLGAAGLLIWGTILDPVEKSETRHIPIIGSSLIVLGIVFALFFKPKKG